MRVLIVDSESRSRTGLQRRLADWGHESILAASAEEAWPRLRRDEPDVVLLRAHAGQQPPLDLIRRIRVDLPSQYLYTLVMADEKNVDTVVSSLEAGADEVLCRPFVARELRARLHSAERVANLGRAWAANNRQMRADLDAGARFAKSLLPKPQKTPWAVDYRHVPAAAVSGDAFGYHWIDREHFAVYLLDASGHGLDAALLAVSVMNVLRSEMLPETDFRHPSEVLGALGRAFPMEDYGDKCFTIWYGIVTRSGRKLSWAGGGHPPAVLIPPGGDAQLLWSNGPVMGAVEFDYATQTCTVPKNSRLYLYSDGVSEVRLSPDEHRSTEAFCAALQTFKTEPILDAVLDDLRRICDGRPLEDDVSIVEVRF